MQLLPTYAEGSEQATQWRFTEAGVIVTAVQWWHFFVDASNTFKNYYVMVLCDYALTNLEWDTVNRHTHIN